MESEKLTAEKIRILMTEASQNGKSTPILTTKQGILYARVTVSNYNLRHKTAYSVHKKEDKFWIVDNDIFNPANYLTKPIGDLADRELFLCYDVFKKELFRRNISELGI